MDKDVLQAVVHEYMVGFTDKLVFMQDILGFHK